MSTQTPETGKVARVDPSKARELLDRMKSERKPQEPSVLMCGMFNANETHPEEVIMTCRISLWNGIQGTYELWLEINPDYQEYVKGASPWQGELLHKNFLLYLVRYDENKNVVEHTPVGTADLFEKNGQMWYSGKLLGLIDLRINPNRNPSSSDNSPSYYITLRTAQRPGGAKQTPAATTTTTPDEFATEAPTLPSSNIPF